MKIRKIPNTEHITQAIKDNDGYCPCKISKDFSTRCVCQEFREMKEEGSCGCGYLYKYEETGVKELNNTEKIKILYHTDIDPISAVHEGEWVDLRSAEAVEMKQGEFKLISLGVSMELPKGYEAHIVPRSSTFKNFGVLQTNSPGIVDNRYSGSNDIWKFPALAMRNTVINKNDRICQFRIVKNQPDIEFEIVDSLDNENRGGIGSTGVR